MARCCALINFMQRIVQPEILDHLEDDDPAAIASRGDLRRLNWIMGHASILSRALTQSLQQIALPSRPLKIVELGGGDGTMILEVARRLSSIGIRADVELIDRQRLLAPDVAAEISSAGWSIDVVCADALEWIAQDRAYDLLVANLFLHHFEPAAIRSMFGSAARHCRVVVACEPRRNAFALSAAHLVRWVGCNEVTQRDAVTSIRAGFAGTELSDLWPPVERWGLRESRAGFFSHLFVGVRA